MLDAVPMAHEGAIRTTHKRANGNNGKDVLRGWVEHGRPLRGQYDGDGAPAALQEQTQAAHRAFSSREQIMGFVDNQQSVLQMPARRNDAIEDSRIIYEHRGFGRGEFEHVMKDSSPLNPDPYPSRRRIGVHPYDPSSVLLRLTDQLVHQAGFARPGSPEYA